eukprot:CAMPEP_0206233740 /NCGR_PEP_ID=MMETSP0047_2-20121206/12185_1 /ASSEMBLY_ACC=CAM_ASM_000192 /TAXON_ID=195065 /ORGANISM="Chroomonas mesostigmatica_cf, Strain CCMP1168" /LENGTH=89 /DNA_ID=CAMNT_0053657713 /DNA_START=23 /DNA_END=292 /DNA_ORIENTATION=+
MGLQEDFDAASKEASETKEGPLSKISNEQKLTLYSHFKQATTGDCNTAKPGMLDFTGKAKWDAWDKLKGMSKEDAMKKYVDSVAEFKKG